VIRRHVIVFFVLIAMLWQSAAAGIAGPSSRLLGDVQHAALHLDEQAHHHHDDGSWHVDDSAESVQHLMADHVQTSVALLLVVGASFEPGIRFEPVAPDVWAFIGDIGPRTVANEALNANLGLVVTRGGAIVIDSGATRAGARRIHDAVRRVTDLPVRWVINTGTQDHRWLGNGHFAAAGAELIAHAHALPDMRARAGDQLQALRALLGAAADGTDAAWPTRLVTGTDTRLELDGTVLHLVHHGGGHTPGDTMVWLPAARVLFAGDIAYVDRLLAVLPASSTGHWVTALNAMAALAPRHIVPGHGRITDVSTVQQQSRDYPVALRTHMKRAVEQGIDLGEATRSFDLRPWRSLANAAELHPGNASRTYLELERE
jgi:glyoxylase-like metal-dependent hydrolase (beta-lactamase superfamily II)